MNDKTMSEVYNDPKEKAYVVNVAPDGSKLMSDGTVIVPEEPVIIVGDPNKGDDSVVAVAVKDEATNSAERTKEELDEAAKRDDAFKANVDSTKAIKTGK